MPRPTDRAVSDHVSERMFARREELGISRSAMAGGLNMSEPSLYYYESGKRRVTVDILITASGLLGKPIDYFFEGLDIDKPDALETNTARSAPAVEVKPVVVKTKASPKTAKPVVVKTKAGTPKAKPVVVKPKAAPAKVG